MSGVNERDARSSPAPQQPYEARSNRGGRLWSVVHTWSSLVATVFLLVLCLTGLPLIFAPEIDALTATRPAPQPVADGTPAASLDRVVASGHAHLPSHSVQFVFWDDDQPGVVLLSIGASPTSDYTRNRVVRIDAHTAAVLGEIDVQSGLLPFLLRVHTELLLGLKGKIFLGIIGICFVLAIVSGIAVYGPSMRRLRFGEVRRHRVAIVRWLDIHNLVGIVVAGWMLVVGATGVLNAFADLTIKYWQYDQLADMLGKEADRPRPSKLSSVQDAADAAQAVATGMKPSFIAFPQSIFSSASHYAVFMKGASPLTSRLLKPVICDAASGRVVDSRTMPWYVTALLVSQPLHFGDYGGLPLKVIWALLTLLTIYVIGSGLVLWSGRVVRAGRRRDMGSFPSHQKPRGKALGED